MNSAKAGVLGGPRSSAHWRRGHLDLETLKQTVGKTLVRLAPSAENGLLSECCTRQGLELERWAVKQVNATKNSCPALNSTFVPAAHLSQEQKEAVTSILGTRDRVFSFRGVAGAGKTTTLKEVQRGLSETGHPVFAITPTASAARVLRNEGFSQATTVEDFLRNGEKRGGLRNAVVICDEAGLKSNRQARRCSGWHRSTTCVCYSWATFVSMFPWKLVISCVFSKRTANWGSAKSVKFIGRFLQTIVLRSHKWPQERSAKVCNNWTDSTGFRKDSQTTLTTQRPTFCGLPIRDALWIGAWLCRLVGRKIIALLTRFEKA